MAVAANTLCMPPESEHGVSFLRGIVEEYLNRHQYETALFWADKIVTLTAGAEDDVYRFAEVLYIMKQYHRAISTIKLHNLDKDNIKCIMLMARCHFECKEYSTVVDIINPFRKKPALVSSPATLSFTDAAPRSVVSSMHLLCGRAYEASDNQDLASECFREALRLDVCCFEAIDHLMSHHMLTGDEEQSLLARLPIKEQSPDPSTADLIRVLYESRLNKYSLPDDSEVPESLSCVTTNSDVIVSIAERYYYNSQFKRAFRLTSSIVEKDPYNEKCLPLHVALLVELKKPHELFIHAHRLVDHYPSKAISWYAVGCYYYATEKNDLARRYLFKATSLDHYFGAAWIAFGHSFAIESEHDQATAAYSTASHVMKGCHLPLLYVGLEHGLASNGRLAEKFFIQALKASPADPYALHEVGVVEFLNERYAEAEARMLSALRVVELLRDEEDDGRISPHPPTSWEPLLNNLGHVYRKLRRYDDAIDYHNRALVLCRNSASTYAALGFCHMLCLRFSTAIECLHKALSLHKEDAVSTSLLSAAAEEMKASCAIDDLPDVPLYPFDGVQRDASLLQENSGTPSLFLTDSSRLASRHEEQYHSTNEGQSIEDVSMDISSGMP